MRFPKKSRNTPILGTLELRVLQSIWKAEGAVMAADVQAMLAPRELALSTVQGTLERLHRKNILSRTKSGRAYVYEAATSREQLIGSLIAELSHLLADGRMEPVISGFVDLVSELDDELLAELETALADARRRRSAP